MNTFGPAHNISEHRLARLVDDVCAEYVKSGNFGKRRDTAGGKLATDGDDAAAAAAAAVAADDDASYSFSTTDADALALQHSNAKAAAAGADDDDQSLSASFGESAERLKVFREECFVPCFMSNSEAKALMFLCDALAQHNSATSTAALLSAVYRSRYSVPLPAEMRAGVADYATLARGKVNWAEHAVALRAMHDASVWSDKTGALAHEDVWRSALHCENAAAWSVYFHTLHALGALKSDETAKQIVAHLSAGGLCNRGALAKLHASLEGERCRAADAEHLLDVSARVLQQATHVVQRCDTNDVLKLYHV